MLNFHLALMVSQGVPMLYMGDEYAHTKLGNNNSWCQDNPLNWFLWNQLKERKEFFHFYKGLIHFRASQPLLRKKQFLQSYEIEWHGRMPCAPFWEHEDQFVAFTLLDYEKGEDLYVAFNASNEQITITLPKCREGKQWRTIANSSLEPGNNFFQAHEAPLTLESQQMLSHSSLLLKALSF
jgi:isoamylase/glycogen operon protein